MLNIELRMKAREDRQTFFETGRPCKRGHYSKRYTSTGGCVECLIPGHGLRALHKYQEGIVKRYALNTLVPTSATTQQIEELDRYLHRCLVAFANTQGWHATWFQNPLTWAEEAPDRSIRDYKG